MKIKLENGKFRQSEWIQLHTHTGAYYACVSQVKCAAR